MRRWFKKIVRAILCLIPVFSVFFFSSPSYALKYEYKGIPWNNSPLPAVPCYSLNSDNKYYFDNTSTCGNGYSTVSGASFGITFRGDAYDSDFISNVNVTSSQSYLTFDSSGDYTNVRPIFTRGYRSSEDRFVSIHSIPTFYNISDIYNPSILSPTFLRFNSTFGQNGLPNFDLNSVPYPPQSDSILTCRTLGEGSPGGSQWNNANGAKCPGVWNLREYIADQILDYPYSSSGFYRYSSAISVDGTTYSNTFSFSDLFDRVITKFSSMQIPLADMDSGYFYDYHNVYAGRSFEFSGSFKFDGSFAWHPNIENTGYFGIVLQGISRDTGLYVEERHSCITNLVTVSGYKLLEYSCDFDLENNYIYVNPYLFIANNVDWFTGGSEHDYVWLTDSNWSFYTNFLITDDDDTPGGVFNEHLTGGGEIPGDAENLIDGDSAGDFFSNLSNLFIFSIPAENTPLNALFNNFSDQSSCASIPIIAGMIHSNETQICPWFDSTTRSITTPILSLFSVFILFHFIMRWLGSSSGNESGGGY